MTKSNTFFGTMEIMSEDPKVERMTFDEAGRAHKHNIPEYCYVLSGSGLVMGSDKEYVAKGDFCKVPPGVDHWMVPKEKPFTLLIFYGVLPQDDVEL